MTPVNPVVEGLRTEIYSRPPTPTAMLDKDEKEDFLKRENELTDALAERESGLAIAEKLVKELKEELAFLKEQEASLSKVNLFIIWYPDRNVDKSIYSFDRKINQYRASSTISACKSSDWIMTTKKALLRSTFSKNKIRMRRTSWRNLGKLFWI
jgi:DNA-binding MarR family transcriptional regulator